MRPATGYLLSAVMITTAGCAALDQPGAKPTTSAKVVPGETLGDAILQRDSRIPVMMAAVTKMSNKDCPASAFEFQDTKVLSQPKEVEGMAVFTRWRELWKVKGCDEIVDVEVTYLNHFLDGTTISAR